MCKLVLRLLFCFILFPLGTACEKAEKKNEFAGLGKKDTRENFRSIKINGVFVPALKVKIKSEFSGRLENLSVVKGQIILAKTPLFRIEDDNLTQELSRLRARLQVAETQLEQSERLATHEG